MIRASRYHDISCGHRVAGHESKCAYLHGHNYRIHFTVEADALDSIGRVMDFSVIKSKLCMWVETFWDHKFLAWSGDPVMLAIAEALSCSSNVRGADDIFGASVIWVPFNPTAENMAQQLLTVIGPQELKGTGCRLVKVVVEETRKCSAEACIETEVVQHMHAAIGSPL